MASNSKEKHGALFNNHAKNPHPQAPGYRGTCVIEGRRYNISAWVRKTGKESKYPNEQFLSLKFDETDENGNLVSQEQGAEQSTSKPF